MPNPTETQKVLIGELIETPLLREEILTTAQSFRERAEDDEIRVSYPFYTGGRFTWQLVDFGYQRKKPDQERFRGYLMIEPVDFPLALRLVDKIATERLKIQKATQFKWLLQSLPKFLKSDQILDLIKDQSNIGRYFDLQPTDPRVALYANESSDINEILSALANNPAWERVETHRTTIPSLFGQQAPIRGTSPFVDSTGREWRSLNFNTSPGSSESQIKPEMV